MSDHPWPNQVRSGVYGKVDELEAELVRERARADGLEKKYERLREINSKLVETHNRNLVYQSKRERRADELREALRWAVDWIERVQEMPLEEELEAFVCWRRARAALSGDET